MHDFKIRAHSDKWLQMNKMISSLSLFFVLFSLSSAAIISVEMSNFKAILLDRLPYPFYKLTSTTQKSIDSSMYSTTKQASTIQRATDSSSVRFFEKSDATTKSMYTTEMPPNSTNKYSYSSKNYTNLKPTNSSMYATTKSAFTSQKSTDSSVKYSYSSVSTDKTPVTTPKTIPKETSCADYFLQGYNLSGVYKISPPTKYKTDPFLVFCDMNTNGGGWTVFQRRGDYEPLENFTRNWNEYKNGFGQLDRDFWLGNDHLFVLTNQENVELRIDIEDFKEDKKWAQYSQFRIQDENNSYKLSISGYKGDVGDILNYHNNKEFSTFDKDTTENCANQSKGGWWYYSSYCWTSSLNGFYFKTNASDNYQGTVWYTWEGYVYSIKKTEMKIRPTNFLST